ncbi:hypothetical protein SAMN04488112_10163 [Melghirimyces thermohalophilus]|uniref:Bacteriocin (Lactococcin_972) n=1 Tax=Melghirimyces thermohalophilus TaxID=1236220 RepID=A0A1G6HLP3_9BACL|nr:hypothetical protein [Melghirimyces thermohalophilus]SDB95083.1 hypothetical protein SAMN04488112_10163 [Melghirimyces thermohalophilus]
MKIKKRVVQLLSVGLICGSLSVPASAAEVYQGWSEGELNTKNVGIEAVDHNGWVEPHPDDPYLERAAGETTWNGVYHYTRARMESGDQVITDSFRQWGWDYTNARSPYANILYTAKTYYGN